MAGTRGGLATAPRGPKVPPGVSVGVPPGTVLWLDMAKSKKTAKRKCGGTIIPVLASARPQLPVTTGDDHPLVRGRDSLVSRRDCSFSPDFFHCPIPFCDTRLEINVHVQQAAGSTDGKKGRLPHTKMVSVSQQQWRDIGNHGEQSKGPVELWETNAPTQQSTRGGQFPKQAVPDCWYNQGDRR